MNGFISWRARHPWAALLLCVAAAASHAQSPDTPESRALHALFERDWEDNAREFPEWATYRGDHRQGDKLTDMSAAAMAARDARVLQVLEQARAIRRDALSATDRVSLDLFLERAQRSVDLAAFPGYRTMSLRALGGPHTALPDLLNVSPVQRREQVLQMIARLVATPKRLDDETLNLRRGMAAGYVSSRDVLQRVLTQIDGQLPADVTASPFYTPFTRLSSDIPAEERSALQAQAREAITSHVAPALRRLRAFIADEYLPKAPADGALKNYPDGARVYEMLIRQQTTTTLSAQEIHALGQRELSRLRAEMEAVMRQTRFDGDFAAFVKVLNSDPKFFHTSPETLIAGYRDIAKRLDAEMPRLFAELPRAPYGVQPMPAHMGANRAEYYNGPAQDGSRGGTFFANGQSFKRRPIWAMETLVAHEGVPGHHMQVARASELKGLPSFRRSGGSYTAFSEGWALYAETLGSDMGLYTDPYSRFGHLQAQAFRAARLVTDTGIHALGWNRQQAIDFMVDRTGQDREFITGEIDRYTSMPAQALAYMIGKLKFDELRDRAKTKLGAKFDIRRFHNAVLDNGALPLGMLDKLVDEWIAEENKRKVTE
jgi:uncharacterized protein (DUF885 family)